MSDDDGVRYCTACKLDVPIAAYCTNCGKDFGSFRGYTSGKAHSDPMPWLQGDGSRYATKEAYYTGLVRQYAPRPEYDNHNPILVWFRAVADDSTLRAQYGEALVPILARDFLLPRFIHAGDYAPAQITHAFRVLAKLAALTTTPNGVTD